MGHSDVDSIVSIQRFDSCSLVLTSRPKRAYLPTTKPNIHQEPGRQQPIHQLSCRHHRSRQTKGRKNDGRGTVKPPERSSAWQFAGTASAPTANACSATTRQASSISKPTISTGTPRNTWSRRDSQQPGRRISIKVDTKYAGCATFAEKCQSAATLHSSFSRLILQPASLEAKTNGTHTVNCTLTTICKTASESATCFPSGILCSSWAMSLLLPRRQARTLSPPQGTREYDSASSSRRLPFRRMTAQGQPA